MAKYYAVRNGKEAGIYNSWTECKKQVEGHSNAEYKGFSTLEEANEYLGLSTSTGKSGSVKGYTDVTENKTKTKTLRAYVDGSYSKENSLYSYGCIIIDGDKIERLSDVGNDVDLIDLWNVAGELTGAMKAIEWASNNNHKNITIYHDYEGIAKWASGDWRAKKKGTKGYIEFIEKYRQVIKIEFIKVAAHTGVRYNEEADILAKSAIQKYINNNLVMSRLDSSQKTKEIELFYSIMAENDNVKNKISFIHNGVEITESKLRKFAKTFWKETGHKINEIEDLKIQLEWENLDIKITMNIKVKNGESQKLILHVSKLGGNYIV
ncbi:viroplasmin family protein [Paenibacillus sp. sgz500992]|uniref:ribonuclease H1 domain-containing protein n=1 Tax=Paenibacillus sp. sgz500992 TaxID=3242476 RepID=UPI0036D3408B